MQHLVLRRASAQCACHEIDAVDLSHRTLSDRAGRALEISDDPWVHTLVEAPEGDVRMEATVFQCHSEVAAASGN